MPFPVSAPAPATDNAPSTSLDPDNWQALRAQGHRMLDDMFDHLQSLRDQPVWRWAPPEVREQFDAPPPLSPSELADVHAQFLETILPYGGGNAHPGFFGWVQGGGTGVGMLAEMLAAGFNANVGGRDHMAIVVEQQIAAWMRDLFGFPETAHGLFLTGASQANFVAVLLARSRALSQDVRQRGVAAAEKPLIAYASSEVHGCVPRALDMAGLGSDNLRRMGVNAAGQIDLGGLRTQIAADRQAGLTPFLVIGSAGTVNTGAVDDLHGLADIARDQDLFFHVDGALGALGVASPELAPQFAGLERADSLAFDFHKWGQVPYDAGFLLTRDGEAQRRTFAADAAYLTRSQRGLAAGDDWPCDYGPDLSRGFRALKTWFTLKTYGLTALGESMAANCRLARALAARIETTPELELLAPVALNIVCFGYRSAVQDINARIVEDLHLDGAVAPSMTLIRGRPVIRAAFVNHRTNGRDVEHLLTKVLEYGRKAEGR